MKKVHYPNLNFVRFFAAFLVIIHHTEQLKYIHGYPGIWHLPYIEIMGKLGVDVFFVLSGFLITSLLFVEIEESKTIAIKNFLMRRVLRIWPVYFLVMGIAFLITPHIRSLQIGTPFISAYDNLGYNVILYVLFLPHVQVFLIGPICYCAQAWSIGIEEYFYLFWPFVVKKLKVKGIVIFIIAFVIVYLLVCVLFRYLSHATYSGNQLFQNITLLLFEGLKFDCLLIGALFGILHTHTKERKFWITSRVFQVALYLVEILLVWKAKQFGGFYWEIHAVIYGLIIFNLVRLETSLFNFEYPVFNFLGKISYGMYMYHFLVINVAILVTYHLHVSWLLYPLAYGGVIAAATLSYNYLEKYFLKKKISYSNILTG